MCIRDRDGTPQGTGGVCCRHSARDRADETANCGAEKGIEAGAGE